MNKYQGIGAITCLFCFLCFVFILVIGWEWRKQTKIVEEREREYIETADIEFTRCKSDHSLWCLTVDQYIELIQQLSTRKECKW